MKEMTIFSNTNWPNVHTSYLDTHNLPYQLQNIKSQWLDCVTGVTLSGMLGIKGKRTASSWMETDWKIKWQLLYTVPNIQNFKLCKEHSSQRVESLCFPKIMLPTVCNTYPNSCKNIRRVFIHHNFNLVAKTFYYSNRNI